MNNMNKKAAGNPVHVMTERFELRSQTTADICERWIAWLDDRDILEPLNTGPRGHTRESLARQLEHYDNHNHYNIGIYVRGSGELIGYHEINTSRLHHLMMTNVLIGEKHWWGKNVVLETRAALLDHFFFDDTIVKAIGKPLSRNFPMIYNYRVQGWTLEGILRSQVVSRYTGRRLDQYEFGLLREEWAAIRGRRPEGVR